LEYTKTKDWKTAFFNVIPPRKLQSATGEKTAKLNQKHSEKFSADNNNDNDNDNSNNNDNEINGGGNDKNNIETNG
jgi:hypothetical protein